MQQHPIEKLMGTSMESIREMVDVSTVVGDPVRAQDGSTIIPVSRVSFGFVAGGGEYAGGVEQPLNGLPFAGGSGAGVTVVPMGFLVCGANGVRMLSAQCVSPGEKLVEMIPQALDALGWNEQGKTKENAPGCGMKKGKMADAPRVHAAYQES